MMRYITKPEVVQAVQLRWDTWGEVCDILGPDLMGDDRIHGVAITDAGVIHEMPSDEASHIGLMIPNEEGRPPIVVTEGKYIVLNADNTIFSYDERVFNMHYQEVDPT